MKVAVIGCGEVGRGYAAAGAAHGMSIVMIDPKPSPAALDVAASIGTDILPSITGDALARVDRVWICVSGDLVTGICATLAGLGLTGSTLVVDLTTASPSDKQACHDVLAAVGVPYVDVVIMGAAAVSGATTAVLGSGHGVGLALAEFASFGAPTSEIPDGGPGDAASLKLLRTILTKGLESLAVESLVAAERAGLRQNLYDVMGDIDQMGFVGFLDMLVRTHVVHAERRLHEVQRASQQLADMAVPSAVLPGSAERFAATTASRRDAPPPAEAAADIDVAVAWLSSVHESSAAERRR